MKRFQDTSYWIAMLLLFYSSFTHACVCFHVSVLLSNKIYLIINFCSFFNVFLVVFIYRSFLSTHFGIFKCILNLNYFKNVSFHSVFMYGWKYFMKNDFIQITRPTFFFSPPFRFSFNLFVYKPTFKRCENKTTFNYDPHN